MRSSFSLTIAMLNLSIMCSAMGQPGERGVKGLPGEDWNDGTGGERGHSGPQGPARPQLYRPYLKPKKGRSNVPCAQARPKKNSR